MDNRMLDKFDNPRFLGDDNNLFTNRIFAAISLVEQFCCDEKKQICIIEKPGNQDILDVFMENNLGGLGKKLLKKVQLQLHYLSKKKTKVNWKLINDRIDSIFYKYY